MVPEKTAKPERYSMMRDMQKEFAGAYSTMKDMWKEFMGGDQVAREWVQPLNPKTQALKWMKEHQHSYMDAQLDFWLLLRPLTDGGEESSRHLARRLWSVWHWVSALDPPICLPTPSLLNIGIWLWEDYDVKDRQQWIEAYVCSLQCVAEASVGQSWTTEGETMVPQVNGLVETFMAMTGMRIPPHVLCQCWPTACDEMPVQNLEGIREYIVCKLDEVVM